MKTLEKVVFSFVMAGLFIYLGVADLNKGDNVMGYIMLGISGLDMVLAAVEMVKYKKVNSAEDK